MIRRIENMDLGSRNTFGMKVRCALFVEVTEEGDLPVLDFDALPQPVFVMGGGSNLLFTGDFPGTILHVAIGSGGGTPSGDGDVMVTVGAGVVFDDFCAWAAKENLWGPENLSLIPGEVGASAVQNIGAYGVEAKDIIETIHAWDRSEGCFTDIHESKCNYGYRSSSFKNETKGRFIITSVTFRLSHKPQPKLDYGGVRKALEERLGGPLDEAAVAALTPQLIREVIIDIRRNKLPDPAVTGSAGSFFKNPVISREHFERIVALARQENGPDYRVPFYEVGDEIKVPAAWMIEQCGFKGERCGGAQVYPRQPLVIINESGSATPREVMDLRDRIISRIEEKYGITLHCEVETV